MPSMAVESALSGKAGLEETRDEATAGQLFCLVPRELAGKLGDALERHFAQAPGVTVITERRARARRRGSERRQDADPTPPRGIERRLIRSPAGRRVAERRAETLAVPAPSAPLPRRAQRHAERLLFFERVEPTPEERRDAEALRLVARIQAGDEAARGCLYELYVNWVFGYLRLLLRDTHEAEDAAQEVFVKVLQALPAYEHRGRPFRAWLFTLAKNHALNHLRKQGRLTPEEPDRINHRIEAAAEDADPPSLDWMTDTDILLFVERLSIPQRQVLALRFMLDLTDVQAAAVLGRTPSEVRVIQTRAIAYLRKRLIAIGRGPKPERQASMKSANRKPPVVRARRFALTAPR